jgi:hypothetical protein
MEFVRVDKSIASKDQDSHRICNLDEEHDTDELNMFRPAPSALTILMWMSFALWKSNSNCFPCDGLRS